MNVTLSHEMCYLLGFAASFIVCAIGAMTFAQAAEKRADSDRSCGSHVFIAVISAISAIVSFIFACDLLTKVTLPVVPTVSLLLVVICLMTFVVHRADTLAAAKKQMSGWFLGAVALGLSILALGIKVIGLLIVAVKQFE